MTDVRPAQAPIVPMRTLQVADRAPASRSPRPSADSFGKCRPIGAYDYPYIKKFKKP
ncbi:hypothetical protein [Burkholderia ubonensis]|uniref:hypothetical protein n=1 Tax=Burkholderia ubonensis TaxID=101571 RepID=UPI000A94EC67|nr:hypothetical protein [Burkholderia ubonensis]